MDRVLTTEHRNRSRRTLWLTGLLGATALGGLVWATQRGLQTTIDADKIRTAVVQTGPVEQTLTATGEVIPAFEQAITSPIRASIRRVLLTPGARVRPGQPLVELDKSLTQIELEKLQDQLALKQNSIEQLRMRLDKNLYDADVSDQIKSLNINRLRAELDDAKRLLTVGGRTPEDVTRAENALRIAQLEKKQLENELAYNRRSMGASLKESQLQASIEGTNLRVLTQKLRQADVRADRAGVLTWVNENVGSAVAEGDMLAKVADLASFRVEGACSDAYADQLRTGLPVIIRINDTELRGLITQVKPAVQNSTVRFAVSLDDDHNSLLRPNQKVDLYVVTQQRSRAIRVANGPAFTGKRTQYVFVRSADNVAHRREIEVGVTSFDWVEIKRGLQPGEQVILTNLNEYEHLQQLTITPTRP
ncbi:efflux RND transporter periplasmic adaptor subunit [Spirosoma luteolum]